MSARAVLVLALLAGSAGAADAADPTPPVPAALPRVSTLPAGHVPELPLRARPVAIAASERVPGFWATRPYAAQAYRKQVGRAFPQFVMVHGSEAAAEAAIKGRGPGLGLRDTPCFLSSQSRGTPTAVVEWSSTFSGTATVHVQDNAAVHALRAEEVVIDQDGKATLQVAQAWVDARTLGVRLASRTSLPLALVATGPRGLQIWALRRERDVEVVVTQGAAARAHPFSQGMQFLHANGIGGGASQCGHVRFALRAAGGDGDMATVQADVPLPPRDGERPGDTSILAAFGLDKLPRDQQSTRARQLRIGVSTSATSRDPDAVISVGMGWVGKDRNLF